MRKGESFFCNLAFGFRVVPFSSQINPEPHADFSPVGV